MKTTIEFLDALKSRNGGASDYAIAKILGLTRGGVSSYRTGRSFFDDSTAIKVAKLLEISPAFVIAAVHSERAKSEEEKTVWRDIFEKFGGIAASVVIGVSAYTLPAPSAYAASIESPTLYIMLNRFRRYKKSAFQSLFSFL